MAIQAAICPQCGGALNVDDVDLNGFCKCPFCETSHKVIEVITIDGLPTAKSLLANAMMCVEDNNAEKAVKLFNEVLAIKPNCHEAWWGLYLCNSYFDRYYNYKDKYGNSGPLTKAGIMERTINKYAARAIEYAPPSIAEDYKQKIRKEQEFIESVRRGDHDRKTSGKSGCYIATAVYGDYACDEVVALRRWRDDCIAKRPFGRLFIRLYYSVSPSLSRYIKPDSAAGRFIRRCLDKKARAIMQHIA